MPRTIKADGRTITVPDDATPEEINQIVGPAPTLPKSTDTVQAAPTFGEKLRSMFAHPLNSMEAAAQPKSRPRDASMGEMIATDLSNVGAGATSVARHPLRTVGNILSQGFGVRPVVENLENAIVGKEVNEPAKLIPTTPEEAAFSGGQALSLAGAGAGAGRVLPKLADVLPKDIGKRSLEAVTKTGPREIANLVKETKAENVSSAEKAATKTAGNEAKHAQQVAEQTAKRKADVGKFFEKKTGVEAENAEKRGAVDRKEALNRGVERLDTEFKSDLKAAREKAHAAADAKYQALNAALDPVQANPEFLPSALQDAMDKIKGSDTEPTILKDMAKKTQHGDVLTYRDLQGYSSELGRELTKGTLPGDVYAAYDTLQEAIGDEMQRIANEHNLGPQLADARASWRQLKQTFYDPKSPAARALKSTERGGAIKHFQGKDQTGIGALAKYDPSLAQKANVIRGYQAEAANLPKKVTVAKALPKLPDKPAPIEAPKPVTPETKTIGTEDIREAKAKGLEQRANVIRRRGEWIATGAAGYRALSSILHGNLGAVPPDLLEGGIAVAGVEGISRLLENPKVVEFLTRPTERDVAQVPEELRGDMSQIAKIARSKGIVVDPRLYAAASATQAKKRPGDILPKTQ